MSYSIRPIVQYAVIDNANGLPISVCKDQGEAIAILNSMAGHGMVATPQGTWCGPIDHAGKPYYGEMAKPYTFANWARNR